MSELLAEAKRLLPGTSMSGRLCPNCNGGGTGEKSAGLFKSDDGAVYGWKCHRASCEYIETAGCFPSLEPQPHRWTPPTFTARPYPYPLVIPAHDNPIWARLGNPPPTAATAVIIGMAVRDGVPDEVVWAGRDYNWNPLGHMSRDYRNKEIRTWRTATAPWHGYFANTRNQYLWIVEDPVSAARIQLSGGAALCLFGSSLSRDLRRELSKIIERGHIDRLLVALDPDATVAGLNLARTLCNAGLGDAQWVPLVADIKDLEEPALLALREAYES